MVMAVLPLERGIEMVMEALTRLTIARMKSAHVGLKAALTPMEIGLAIVKMPAQKKLVGQTMMAALHQATPTETVYSTVKMPAQKSVASAIWKAAPTVTATACAIAKTPVPVNLAFLALVAAPMPTATASQTAATFAPVSQEHPRAADVQIPALETAIGMASQTM